MKEAPLEGQDGDEKLRALIIDDFIKVASVGTSVRARAPGGRAGFLA